MMSEQPGPSTLATISLSTKEVLVSYGKRTRSVLFNRDDDPVVELANFEEKVKAAFEDILEYNAKLFVQLKDEKWRGEFVDLTPSAFIPDQSVMRVESYNITYTYSYCAYSSYSQQLLASGYIHVASWYN